MTSIVRNVNSKDGNVDEQLLNELRKGVRSRSLRAQSSACLFATGLKKARADANQCHAKTMKSKRSW